MVSNAPPGAINITITGDTTGDVTGTPPNVETGDLDASIDLPLPGWSFFFSDWEISDAPDLGAATIDGSTGEWTYTVDPAEFDALDFGEIAEDTFEVEFSVFAFGPGGGLFVETETQEVTISIEGVCFVMGTPIRTSKGYEMVENLLPGDIVWTRDHGQKEIQLLESNSVSLKRLKKDPSLRPVRIRQNALGPGRPKQDIYVSQQHRVLISGPAVELFVGEAEALVCAQDLCHWDGVDIVLPDEDVRYFHILLDTHEILDANGVPAESLFLGDEALYQLSSEALQELSAIFEETDPDQGPFKFGQAARILLRSFEARAILNSVDA